MQCREGLASIDVIALSYFDVLVALKLLPAELIPLAREHVLLKARREKTVMPLNHAYACANLYGNVGGVNYAFINKGLSGDIFGVRTSVFLVSF